MSTAAAVVLAALAAAVVAGGPPNPLRTRLGTGPERRPGLGTLPPRLRDRASRRRQARQREQEISEACVALSAELRAGMPVTRALSVVSADWPDLFGEVAGRAATGGDVAAALREVARRPGAGSLRALAAGWDVTESTGAPLSRVLVAVADALRAEAGVRREAQSQLASARATARLLAALPFATLVLLSGGDGAAIRFLVSSPYGLACLAGAVTLVGGGLWWVDRLARSATRSSWER